MQTFNTRKAGFTLLFLLVTILAGAKEPLFRLRDLSHTDARNGQRASGLRVYPLPASDVVHFEAESPVSGIRFFDGSGKLLIQR